MMTKHVNDGSLAGELKVLLISVINNNNSTPATCEMFADFASNSTVHGVRYLGERRRHWSER